MSMSVKKIAKSGWIDDLTEEEEIMLKKSHAMDEKLRTSKLPKYKTKLLKE